MIKVINLPKETLETIKNLQIEFIKVMNQIGEVRIEMNNLSELEKKLFIDYKELKNREKQLIDDTGKKFGFGKVDLEKGTLTVD